MMMMGTQKCLLLVASTIVFLGYTEANFTCPKNIKYTTCTKQKGVEGFVVRFENYGGVLITPEKVRDELIIIGANGPIGQLILEYLGDVFGYIPDHFLAGIPIAEVDFQCNHEYSVANTPLIFSLNSFQNDSNDGCLLSGVLSIKDCNLRQFNGEVLKNCNNLKNLTIENSYVEGFPHFPKLDRLEILTINSKRVWNYAPTSGLSKLNITSELVPNLRHLDLSHNAFLDDEIANMVPDLVYLETILLAGNNFSIVPNLSRFYFLQEFTMDLLKLSPEISLTLPSARMYSPDLYFTIRGNNEQKTTVTSLTGDLRTTYVNLFVNLTSTLDGSVYLEALKSTTDGISFIPEPQFLCKCEISWLLRDNPSLLKRVKNAVCNDGRLINEVKAEELACCPTDSLINQLRELETKVKQLENQLLDKRSVEL